MLTSYALGLLNQVGYQTHFGIAPDWWDYWNPAKQWRVQLADGLVYVLNRLYTLFPMFSLSEGTQSLTQSWLYCDYLNDRFRAWGWFSMEKCLDPWKFIAHILLRLWLAPLLCFGVLLLIDQPTVVRATLRRLGRPGIRILGWIDGSSASFDRSSESMGEFVLDDDVRDERHRVATVPAGTPLPLVIRGMSKTYPARGRVPPKRAVQRLDLIVERGECFGLLGVNGAGKTTTLSVLTGATLPSSGSAAVDGADVVEAQTEAFQRLGFCPQENPLLAQLTARETLAIYAELRGIAPATIGAHCTRLLAQIGLSADADRPCGKYSGGTKRKLALAIALVGSPGLLLLDEPSCGLDPASRRQIWDVVLEVRPSRSIVLTTHSMEECEALCTRVGVMVMGRMRCLGGLQHLKSKYGSGYMVELVCPHRMGSSEPIIAELRKLRGVFAHARLVEDNGCRLRVTLPMHDEADEATGHVDDSATKLADVFEGLEAHAARLGIAEYAAVCSHNTSPTLCIP